MGFTSKRGRPAAKASLTVIEGGKIQEKPRNNRPLVIVTSEPIDICYKKGLISADEHRAALHFRWLYTLKFGAPDISAVEYDKFTLSGSRIQDPEWQELREREYAMAVEKLRSSGALKIVLNIAVFGYMPGFLITSRLNKRCFGANYSEVQKLKEGLDLLVRHWHYNNSGNPK